MDNYTTSTDEYNEATVTCGSRSGETLGLAELRYRPGTYGLVILNEDRTQRPAKINVRISLEFCNQDENLLPDWDERLLDYLADHYDRNCRKPK